METVEYRCQSRAAPNHWMAINHNWLVVRPLLWKIWVRQLGWWNSQHMEKQKMFQTTNQTRFTPISGAIHHRSSGEPSLLDTTSPRSVPGRATCYTSATGCFQPTVTAVGCTTVARAIWFQDWKMGLKTAAAWPLCCLFCSHICSKTMAPDGCINHWPGLWPWGLGPRDMMYK